MSHDEPVPAATVVVCRTGREGLDVVMLRRSSSGDFAGSWVFPGGKVDPVDRHADDPIDEEPSAASRRAAVREAREEADLALDPETLVPFAHWVPPVGNVRRFSTWFFLAPDPHVEDIVVDGAEIREGAWLSVREALARAERREIDLVVPTWVTLHTLSAFHDVASAVTTLAARAPRRYSSRLLDGAHGTVAVWAGDAAYESGNLEQPGGRHRLYMEPTGWRFEGDRGAV